MWALPEMTLDRRLDTFRPDHCNSWYNPLVASRLEAWVFIFGTLKSAALGSQGQPMTICC